MGSLGLVLLGSALLRLSLHFSDNKTVLVKPNLNFNTEKDCIQRK